MSFDINDLDRLKGNLQNVVQRGVDEIVEALETGLIDSEQCKTALRNLDALLKIIYNYKFDALRARLPE